LARCGGQKFFYERTSALTRGRRREASPKGEGPAENPTGPFPDIEPSMFVARAPLRVGYGAPFPTARRVSDFTRKTSPGDSTVSLARQWSPGGPRVPAGTAAPGDTPSCVMPNTFGPSSSLEERVSVSRAYHGIPDHQPSCQLSPLWTKRSGGCGSDCRGSRARSRRPRSSRSCPPDPS